MPNEEGELRILATRPVEGAPPSGLRVMKSIRTPRDDTYLVLMPGVMPAGFHISIHASGEFHMKSRELGTVARVNLRVLLESLKTGALDSALASIITPPTGGVPAEGVIIRPDRLPGLGPGVSNANVDLPVATMLEGIERIEITNTSDLPAHIAWLREVGKLPERGLLLLDVDGSKRPTVFINLQGDKPFPRPLAEMPELPPETPMRATLAAAVRQLPRYGGLFISLPEGAQLRDLAHRAGLGSMYDELTRALDGLDDDAFEEATRTWIRDLEVTAAETVTEMLAKGPLQLPRPGASDPKENPMSGAALASSASSRARPSGDKVAS